MLTKLNELLQEKGVKWNHHLLVWATDELIYKKIKNQAITIKDKHILKFRLFNGDEEYYGFKRQEKSIIRHIQDSKSSQKYIEKTVKLKGNIAKLINANTAQDLMLKSRDYLAYKPNGQAYYTDSRMVTIDTLKLIDHE